MEGTTVFSEFLELIYKKSPFQKKKLNDFINRMDDVYFSRAEDFAAKISTLISKQGLKIDYVIDSYLVMCNDMLTEQINFKKTGKYSLTQASDAEGKIYSSKEKMSSYMYGLALSQFLWPNHYAMFDFFINESKKLKDVKTYLEIGPGHGLYLVESLKNFPDANFKAVDISPTSIDVTKNIIESFMPKKECEFVIENIMSYEGDKYDYIVMCEVLEHLDNPINILKKIRSMLEESGALFITTCANCPAIDHIYLYDNLEHIQSELRESGFDINSELVLPVADLAWVQSEGNKCAINYAAMLQKSS